MKAPKIGTIALVVRYEAESPVLVETLCEETEISCLEEAVQAGETDPLEAVRLFRAKQTREDDDFGNYVEELLSQPFVRPEIQEHGVQWLKSKIRIDEFQRREVEASRVIAEYALQVLKENPATHDFLLAGPAAKVRVRIFDFSNLKSKKPRVA